MTDTELLSLLEKVKKALGITGNYQDETIAIYMDEVISFLTDAGVPESVINNPVSVGVISRGVSDLWNYGAWNANLSPYFYQRAIQLCYKTGQVEEEVIGDV